MLPKRKRIERGDRPRAHGKDIAQDAADAGGGALVGLDEGWMVVAFHFESHGQSAADIDDAGIFTRPLKHVRPFGREILEIMARAFVAAVLRPHHGENAQLSVVRLAAEHLDDLLIFVGREPCAATISGVTARLTKCVSGAVMHGASPFRRRPPQSK